MANKNEEIIDSPTGWVAKHIRTYVESGGTEGQKYAGRDLLLLTTRGRKSGKLRRTALYYGVDNGRYILIASNGGSPKHPLWYLNLQEEPKVEVQVGPEVFSAVARPATEKEKPRLWEMMVSIFPNYAAYQKKATRDIPVVVVERSNKPGSTE
ncbi:MAG TPA: nitroreductase family deazaflavin-dependent oxidoreductase [Chloroflexia bacterium]|nr:nitroreductase family deazaflavin-dependent oxidoreductase [Chloroflexia bacterium]